MHRRTFLTGTAASAAFALSGPRLAFARSDAKDAGTLALLTEAADRLAAEVLEGMEAAGRGGARGTLRQLRRLFTPYIWPDSRYHHSAALEGPMETLLSQVEAAQHDDGTFSGGNRHSPPDSAFLMEDMGAMTEAAEGIRHPVVRDISSRLATMMRKAGPALRTGGIHTPNHRWELSAALARIDRVDPNPAYRARIDEWLAEGVDINAEGIYSERSSNYAQAVSNPSLLRLSRLPGLEGLKQLVRRNLETTIDMAEPTYGDVETIYSRRQDQAQSRQTLHTYYLQYRELAQDFDDRRFAGIVRWIEQNDSSQLGDALADFLDHPKLAGPIPAPVQPFVDFQRYFRTVNLVRERRGDMTASFYAGSDWYEDGEPSRFYNTIGSNAGTPLMRSNQTVGIDLPQKMLVAPADDGTVTLSGEMNVPYYLPMPAERRDPDGAYALSKSVDGRFNSSLDFSHRPAHFRRLAIQMVARPRSDGYALEFSTDGEAEVGIAIEITLRPGGTLTGVQDVAGVGGLLTGGEATYTVEGQRLRFGPGGSDVVPRLSSGEQYSWAGGRLNLAGDKVYITGETPFTHTLRLAFG